MQILLQQTPPLTQVSSSPTDRDLYFLLLGAGIALLSAVVTSLLQHFLRLREERIKWQRDKEEREARERREYITRGLDTIILRSMKMDTMAEDREAMISILKEALEELQGEQKSLPAPEQPEKAPEKPAQ